MEAVSGDETAPSGDCPHCDKDAAIGMAACHGVCVVMPVLLPRHPFGPIGTFAALRLERTSAHLPGQVPAPDPSPPKLTII